MPRTHLYLALMMAGSMLAACAGSSGGASSGGTSTISLPGGGSIEFDGGSGDYGSPHGMGKYEQARAAVAGLRPRVAQLMAAGDDPRIALERVTVMSQFANALYARYGETDDLGLLRESVEMGRRTVAECERLSAEKIITGISMPLITAKSEQKVNLETRAPELEGATK